MRGESTGAITTFSAGGEISGELEPRAIIVVDLQRVKEKAERTKITFVDALAVTLAHEYAGHIYEHIVDWGQIHEPLVLDAPPSSVASKEGLEDQARELFYAQPEGEQRVMRMEAEWFPLTDLHFEVKP